jgi:hypothetical protein
MDTLPPVGPAGWRQKLPGFVVVTRTAIRAR